MKGGYFQLSDESEIRARPCPECRLCGSQGRFLYRGIKDLIFGSKGEWNLKSCVNPECGLVWMDPMPLQEDTGKAYHEYYTHREDKKKRPYGILTMPLIWSARQVYSLLKRIMFIRPELKLLNLMYLDKVKPGKLLEIGCGGGQRLARIRSLGWEAEGQEVDPKAAAHARSKYGLTLHLRPLHELGFPDAVFDAVIMNHVIEHLHDPVALLKECYRILKPDGMLTAVTPNIGGWGHRYFGRHWRGLEPPRHLYLFNRKSLRKMAVMSGFNRFEVWTTSARAQVISAGSLDIKLRGRHRMGVPPGIDIELTAMAFQLWAKAVHIVQPDSGDECVLKAVK